MLAIEKSVRDLINGYMVSRIGMASKIVDHAEESTPYPYNYPHWQLPSLATTLTGNYPRWHAAPIPTQIVHSNFQFPTF